MKSKIFKFFIYTLCFFSFFLVIPKCEKALPVVDSSDTILTSKLSDYYNFLVTMKSKGFVFWDFKTFLGTDTSKLPQKLIVIRHDIHGLDIQWAYPTFKIEQTLIGNGHSTFFVMLNNPIELMNKNFIYESDYLKLILYLEKYHFDIQPHISPIDMYIENKHPKWEIYSKDTLEKMFTGNYQWEISKTGRQIKITGADVFNLNEINNTLLTLLPAYNAQWTTQTGLNVQGYSAHGTSTVMNAVLNNAYLLDQFVLLDAGVYEYDAYNSKIFNILTYLSDNNMPSWMTKPDSIMPGRYQLLMHPHVWYLVNKSK